MMVGATGQQLLAVAALLPSDARAVAAALGKNSGFPWLFDALCAFQAESAKGAKHG
jgi:hypothetical protein